ncbi:MAG: cysteine hydrolase [Acidobacteria bacterium]|nr:cysteine hydrolase [Acidobacteriota bacterium]
MKHVLSLLLALVVSGVAVVAADPPPEPAKPVKPALVVIDIQNAFLKWVPEKDRTIAFLYIGACIEKFREHKLPVILVYHTDPKQGPKPGTEAFEFPASVKVEPGDPKVIKNHPSGFKKTDLEKILREKGVNTLFLCGLSATGCVLATYHGAKDLDFRVFMVQNAIMSHDTELTKAVERICDTVTYEAMELVLDSLKP